MRIPADNRLKAIVLSTTMLFVLTEWVLFEVIRTPYRPPADMSTFLGTEKYGVVLFMATLALGWVCAAIHWVVYFRFSASDYAVYAVTFGTLIVCLSLVIANPSWPVTPFERIW